jgi:hypothetical protein
MELIIREDPCQSVAKNILFFPESREESFDRITGFTGWGLTFSISELCLNVQEQSGVIHI